MRSDPFSSIPPSYGSPGREPGSRGACDFLGVSYAPRGRLALGGFDDGDYDDSIEFGEFLRIRGVIDSGDDFEDPDKFVEHLDN